jgi:hypothetical protein
MRTHILHWDITTKGSCSIKQLSPDSDFVAEILFPSISLMYDSATKILRNYFSWGYKYKTVVRGFIERKKNITSETGFRRGCGGRSHRDTKNLVSIHRTLITARLNNVVFLFITVLAPKLSVTCVTPNRTSSTVLCSKLHTYHPRSMHT